MASGYPAIATASLRSRRALLAGYLEQIVEREFAELGHPNRRSRTLRGMCMSTLPPSLATVSSLLPFPEFANNPASGSPFSYPR